LAPPAQPAEAVRGEPGGSAPVSDREQKAYTTFEAAKICHVTHHSIKNWIKQGLIKASRTPGGHYRILEDDLDRFREKYDMFPREKGPSKKRVMIVDDDPDALALMEKILSDEGFELVKVSNATEVGLKAAQLAPDLILLDFLMPEINGFEVCKALRDNEMTRSIPIMAVTCLTKERDIERIFACGADEYLAKPFKVDQLVEKVHELIGRGRVLE
jgi:excisionase family DNA binding protein